MAVERTYTIPLRKSWLKAPKYRRAKKAVNAVKTFLIKHMKSEDVRLGKYLNLEIWKHGMKNPPGKIKVNVIKDEKDVVRAELFGKKIETGEKKEEKTSIAGKLKEKITGKKAKPKKPAKEEKEAEKKTEKQEETKKEEKPAEVKAEKKEAPKEEKAEAKKEEKAEAKPAEKAK